MIPTFLLLALAAPQGIGPIEMDDKIITVAGNGHRATIPCEGRAVTVVGTDHAVSFKGICASLTVTGAGNTVVAGIAPGGRLVVSGTDQKVRWSSSGSVRRTVTGVGNSIVRAGK